MTIRAEEGFTLPELIAAMAIFVIVMLATLQTLDLFTAQSETANRRLDTEQQARTTVDQMSRRLRNLASPTPSRPLAVDKATAYDFVFQSVDPAGPNAGQNLTNVRRLRYCLNSANPADGTIWLQAQSWVEPSIPPVPSTGNCPDSDPRWTTSGVAVRHVANRASGLDRPVWQYDAQNLADITFTRVTLILRIQGRGSTKDTTLASGVFLRNQNRAPVASFTATPTGGGHVILNGSGSQDPEGEPLSYAWYDSSQQIGSGVTLDYRANGTRSLSLAVTDPGGLVGTAPAQVVQVR